MGSMVCGTRGGKLWTILNVSHTATVSVWEVIKRHTALDATWLQVVASTE